MSLQKRLINMANVAFREYAYWTVETSGHDTKEKAITESLLGLLGEYKEYTNALEELPESLIRKEIGDICYYLGLFLNKTAIIDQVEIESNGKDFIDSLAILFENYKKVVRENDWSILQTKEERRKTILEECNNLLYWLYEECVINDFDFLDILNENKEKLLDRLNRNAINGDGDNR